MYPCSFISYLRLHYSMKENLDTFQELVKPMLEHVRVHPELVTGTPDSELDPSRWKRYEVHDIVIECSRVSLDPLESSCEEDAYSSSLWDPASSSSSSPGPPHLSSPFPYLDATFNPQTENISSMGSSVCPPLIGRLTLSLPQLTVHNNSYIQADDVTWSPSTECGLSTPSPEHSVTGSAHPLSRAASISGVKCPSSATVPVTARSADSTGDALHPDSNNQQPEAELDGSVIQPIRKQEVGADIDLINNNNHGEVSPEEESLQPSSSSSSSSSFSSQATPLTSTPGCGEALSFCFTPEHLSASCRSEGRDPAHQNQSPAPPYEPLFQLALPRAASLFVGRKIQEVLDRGGGQQEQTGGGTEDREEEGLTSVSPLKVLDQLITHGGDAHEHLSRRPGLPALNKSLDRTHCGGKQQSMKTKGSAQGEELQSLRSQLLLVHSQLQYERFKRQQHAIRNRRLLRRVINATALEEHSVAMKAQLGMQDVEIQALRESLEEEQRCYTHLQHDTHTRSTQLHTHIQQLLLQQEEEQNTSQRLQSELQECQSRLRDLEAELQKANNKAYNAEHQLTQLSVKVSSTEQLQLQIFLLNQQLVLLRETNKVLTEQLEGEHTHHSTEASMLQCSVGQEFQRLQDSELQHRQKLEAANHRISELESQLTRKEQLILDQKKLLEETKSQSRAELSACQSSCVALRRIVQALQTETLQLYSQVDLDTCSRSNSITVPPAQDSHSLSNKPRPSPSYGMINGALETLSTSPLLLPSCSSSPPLSCSPIDSPLAVGSFLEQRARQLFRPAHHCQNEVEPEEEEEEEAQPESPAIGQEVDEAALLTGSTESPSQDSDSTISACEPSLPHGHAHRNAHRPQDPPSAPTSAAGSLTQAVRQRRRELSIMDYDEMLPEY
ncbi:hypothetical protein LDENG_00260180 [Lucifuga dentata]|nr:hypothetical protein LDENG_00260180 [Lucifuga dentata]